VASCLFLQFFVFTATEQAAIGGARGQAVALFVFVVLCLMEDVLACACLSQVFLRSCSHLVLTCLLDVRIVIVGQVNVACADVFRAIGVSDGVWLGHFLHFRCIYSTLACKRARKGRAELLRSLSKRAFKPPREITINLSLHVRLPVSSVGFDNACALMFSL
jgi:hypothetical protein